MKECPKPTIEEPSRLDPGSSTASLAPYPVRPKGQVNLAGPLGSKVSLNKEFTRGASTMPNRFEMLTGSWNAFIAGFI